MGRDVVHVQFPHLFIGKPQHNLSFLHHPIIQHGGGVVHRTDRDTGRLKYSQQFCLVMLCHEFANDGIENIVVAHPISISFEAWIVDQIFAPDCLE